MRIVSVLKPGLFIYECVRAVILAFSLVYLLPEVGAIPWLAFSSSTVLFPLMSLFLMLDVSAHRVYLPLFTAGKCIGIFSLLGWLIVARQVTMIERFPSVNIIAELILLSGDMLALTAVLFISKDTQKLTEKTETEDKQCE
ncbi:MAG: hypothetical protein LBQ89_07370 [Treponema sp.]|jgi:hypothetical protein|nr:hypothetical protein [Treponema sp.]